MIELGASIESVLQCSVEKDMLPAVISWLRQIEKTDLALSNALGLKVKDEINYVEDIPVPEE